ncbi:MAG TPA: glycoside hydrolase family 15 protein, partial [Micromonosporaceae bacterium]
QLYLPGTPILITRFLSADGVGEVIDFMPIAGDVETKRHRIVRMVQVVRGSMRFGMDCHPAFNYGRDEVDTELFPDGAMFRSPSATMALHVARRDAPLVDPADITGTEAGFYATTTLNAGDIGGVVLETDPHGKPRAMAAEEIRRLYEETRDFWRGWVAKSTYRGRWREMVERSAITLKLMTYAPTGALVAAPTAGLPEEVGGERNWDYRFTWIRDGSFSVRALLALGYREEAAAFMRWLNDRVADARAAERPLKIMYRIDGSPDLDEEILDHFEGYRGSSPVRIGNGATDQLQLDIYGEALDSVWVGVSYGLDVTHQGWENLTYQVDWLCDHWEMPDAGIWETRGGQQEFTYGRLMCWVAFDRAVRLAEHLGWPGDVQRWRTERDRVYRQIMAKGFHPGRGAFVQAYNADVLDASTLYMPLMGLVAPSDPLWQSTLRAMDEELVSDSLVYRYNPSASPDGLAGSEGTFTICSFWYVSALARSGRLEDAQLTFEKMQTYCNPVGLYSEEISSTGEQIGNFPQAFSHLALINAAMDVHQAMDAQSTSTHG